MARGKVVFFFFSSRRRHTRLTCDWSSDVCSSDLADRRRAAGGSDGALAAPGPARGRGGDAGLPAGAAARPDHGALRALVRRRSPRLGVDAVVGADRKSGVEGKRGEVGGGGGVRKK